MKKVCMLILGCCLFLLLSSCHQQETAEISSWQNSESEVTPASSILPVVSYPPVFSDYISSQAVSSAFHNPDQTASQYDEKKEYMQIELPSDGILEFGLTVGRLSGNPSEPSQQTVSTTDSALIKEIVDKINSFVYVRDLKMESDHRYLTGMIGYEFWTKNNDGQKTTYQCSSHYYIQDGAWYCIEDCFDLYDYLTDKLNATWWQP